MDDLYETENFDEPANYMDDDYNDEDQAMLTAAEEEAQQAMATMDRLGDTLKDIQMRQHSVQMSRQYYRASYQANPRSSGGQGRTSSTSTSGNCNPGQSSAPFVCYVHGQAEGESALTTFPSTAEAVEEGFAMIDGSATKLAERDKGNQPLFGFGNSTERRCVSTCKVGVTAGGQSGQAEIHTLNQGVGSNLFSIDAMRTSGAIVGFRSGLLVLTAINGRRIIPLRMSSTSHQLISLAQEDNSFLISILTGKEISNNAPVLNVKLFVLQAVCQAQKLKLVIRLLPRLHLMDRLSRPKLVLHLKGLGKETPEAWSKLEIRQLIHERVEDQPTLAATVAHKTPLEIQINTYILLFLLFRAKSRSDAHELVLSSNQIYPRSERGCQNTFIEVISGHRRYGKANCKLYIHSCHSNDLVYRAAGPDVKALAYRISNYVDETLGVAVSDTDTIAAMQRQASDKILQECQVHGADPAQLSGHLLPRPKTRGHKTNTSGTAASSSTPKAPATDSRDDLVLQLTTAPQDLRK
ncbi:unnamed protein product [Symbiodinium sp. CCMP2592]|nr:unnamed protein product [Symbiodinium sp. CCMP2592]